MPTEGLDEVFPGAECSGAVVLAAELGVGSLGLVGTDVGVGRWVGVSWVVDAVDDGAL